MKKEELISLAERFMQEAFEANCYYNIIKQYAENINEYHEEITLSGAFYTYIYNALVIATFMELAKIYDSNKQSINIKQMMDICEENISLFPQQREFKVVVNDKEIIEKFPYKFIVSSEEEEFFQKEVESQKQFNVLIGANDVQVNVEMTLERYFELFKWKYKKIELQIINLLKQRNKIYAHNDEKSLGNIEVVISDFPLNRRDIDSLISFALEFCRFVCDLLTGIYTAVKPVNINDWKGTLNLVRVGNKYKEIDNELRMKEFAKKYFPET